MNWFDTVKSFYDSGLYDANKVRVFVIKGKITQQEYEQITGEVY